MILHPVHLLKFFFDILKFIFSVEQVAYSLGLVYIPLYTAMTTNDIDCKKMVSDGLHLSKEGNQLLADLVNPFLAEFSTPQFPDWKDKAASV